MASFTIDTQTYLDELIGRTGGDTYTIYGGSLTIREDSRYCMNAPISGVGSLGNVTILSSAGGEYLIDATKIRWMPFSNGSGLIPNIGTIITQNGVSGYLLGVWQDYISTPLEADSSMPLTGYLKFREVEGGNFVSGALNGISADATSSDIVGWIEVVHDQDSDITVPRLGVFQTRGDWFDLGVTTGLANQVIQVPTNGSPTTYSMGLWIETDVADEYEFYPSIFVAGMVSTNLGTDERNKFVSMETNGSMRIGSNGTINIGYVPPAGRKIRIPNIFMRQCLTTIRNVNTVPYSGYSSRASFTTTLAGRIDMEYAYCDWNFSFVQPYSIKIHHSATFDRILILECATAIDIFDGGSGISQSVDVITMLIESCLAGGNITNWVAHRYNTGSSDHAWEFKYSTGQTITGCKTGFITYARNSSGYAFQVTQSSNITFNQCIKFNGQMTFTNSSDCAVNDIDHVDRYIGATDSTTGIYIISIVSSSNNIIIDGITVGLNGLVPNCHPYSGILNCGQSSNITFRNLGRRDSFISGGTDLNPAYIFVSSGNNYNVRLQRCYLSPTRTGAIITNNSDKGNTYESVYGDMNDIMTISDLNNHIKGCGGTNTVAGQSSVYGTHFWDTFTSDTEGRVVLSLNEPTVETSNFISIVSGSPRFTSTGSIVMKNLGDEIIAEMDYYAKGHLSFSSIQPVITGYYVTYSSGSRWGNHDIYYQIDTGNGWNGEWKDFNGTNLSSETISALIGFKLKYRIICATPSTSNLITYVRVNTNTSLESQINNLYPLDAIQTNLKLVDLQPNSEIRIYRVSDGVELIGTENSSDVFTYDYIWMEDVDVNIIIHHVNYEYLRYDNFTLISNGGLIPVVQRYDRNFSNP